MIAHIDFGIWMLPLCPLTLPSPPFGWRGKEGTYRTCAAIFESPLRKMRFNNGRESRMLIGFISAANGVITFKSYSPEKHGGQKQCQTPKDLAAENQQYGILSRIEYRFSGQRNGVTERQKIA